MKLDPNKQADKYFEIFFDYVREQVDIPPYDQDLCRKHFKPIFAKKGSLISKAGKVPTHHNFIVSGFMRNYHLDDNGNEITTDINDGPRFFTSYHYFAHQIPSPENLQCITDCALLRIPHKDVLYLAEVGITQKEYSLKILQMHLEQKNQRILDFTKRSAEERYLRLVKEHPNIIQNVPLKYIASFLGINPGSLSRIRAELA